MKSCRRYKFKLSVKHLLYSKPFIANYAKILQKSKTLREETVNLVLLEKNSNTTRVNSFAILITSKLKLTVQSIELLGRTISGWIKLPDRKLRSSRVNSYAIYLTEKTKTTTLSVLCWEACVRNTCALLNAFCKNLYYFGTPEYSPEWTPEFHACS